MLAFALALDEEAAENFAGGRLGDLRDELDAPDFLVRGYVRGDEGEHFRFGQPVSLAHDDESLRNLARFIVGARHDGHVRNRGVRQKQRLKLGGRDLKRLVFYKLLRAVYD